MLMERRDRRRLAEDAERRGRVSSTPLRGYDTTPRRLDHFNSIFSKSASAESWHSRASDVDATFRGRLCILRGVCELCVFCITDHLGEHSVSLLSLHYPFGATTLCWMRIFPIAEASLFPMVRGRPIASVSRR